MKDKRKVTQRINNLWLKYILTLVIFMLLLILTIIVGAELASRVIWYETDPLWVFLRIIKDNIWLIGGSLCFIAWVLITLYFMNKPIKYLNEVISASEQLALFSEQPIELSKAMKNVQDEMNLVREQALRNAMLAKEAEKRKNDLIVYLAHDLKTPLTSVIGYLTLLHDEPQISMELRAKYTGIALAKAERLEELINEFFDITRFNLTTIELEKEQVNLSRMLEQITYEFNPILEEKGLFWKAEIAPDIEMVCDPNKLARVFDNLIRNAVNYSYRESEICLSLYQAGDNIEIQISNHGKTISKEKLSHIFEQFYRLDSSRSSTTGGAGLGLAISKEIVELHGGMIKAESFDNRIVFTVTFPNFIIF